MLFIAAAALVSAACGAVSPYAAIINGQRATQRDLDRELKAIKNNKAFLQALQAQGGLQIEGTGKNTFDMAFVSRVLTRRIFFVIIHQQVAKRHLKVTEADLTAARRDAQDQFGGAATFKAFPKGYAEEAVRTTAEIAVLQKSLGSGDASPDKIKAYYDAHPDEFQEACVSHILVDDEATAKALKAQLDAGADFADLAKKNSKDNQGADGGSAAKGGSLDCINASQSANFDPDFVAGYKDLPVNKVSDPVKTQFGYHLIKVTDRHQQSLQDATSDITAKLTQNTQQAFNDMITASAKKAKIRVNPRYGTFDRDQLSVVPPEAPPAAGTPTTISPLSAIPGG